MSSYTTHALIGATGGVALERGLTLLNGVHPMIALEAGGARMAGFALASALLATWSDIDEPGSFISRRVRLVLTLLVGGLLALVGWSAAAAGMLDGLVLPSLLDDPATAPTVRQVAGAIGGLLVGLVGGSWLGYQVLIGIRNAAGGHRRFTHSLVLAVGLTGLAVGLWWLALDWLALIPLALAWGLVLHVIGDIVTPSGVPLLWPFSSRSVRVFPDGTPAGAGEAAVALGATVGLVLLLAYAS
jgi:membrane-bound metal-dependent hydrolase YbcI (DUF457 family)